MMQRDVEGPWGN